MLPLVIIALMVLAGAVGLMLMYHQKSFKMTSRTEGRVVRAEERVVRGPDERHEETVLTCAYEVRGTAYELTHTLRGRRAGRFPAGSVVPVLYNPAHPNMARVAKA